MLMLARSVKRVTKDSRKELTATRDPETACMLGILFLPDTILSTMRSRSEGKKREPVSENAYFYRYFSISSRRRRLLSVRCVSLVLNPRCVEWARLARQSGHIPTLGIEHQ